MSRVTHLQVTFGDFFIYGDASAAMSKMLDENEQDTLAFMEAWSKAIYSETGETHQTRITPPTAEGY